jgi:hypothetical protein
MHLNASPSITWGLHPPHVAHYLSLHLNAAMPFSHDATFIPCHEEGSCEAQPIISFAVNPAIGGGGSVRLVAGGSGKQQSQVLNACYFSFEGPMQIMRIAQLPPRNRFLTERFPYCASDPSLQRCRQLLLPKLSAPPKLEELRAFLVAPPSAPIPVTSDGMGLISGLDIAHNFVLSTGKLARAISTSLCFDLGFLSSESFTVIAEHLAIVNVLLALDQAMGEEGLNMSVERNEGDSASLMTLKSPSGRCLRPDGVIRGSDGVRMLAKVIFDSDIFPAVPCLTTLSFAVGGQA